MACYSASIKCTISSTFLNKRAQEELPQEIERNLLFYWFGNSVYVGCGGNVLLRQEYVPAGAEARHASELLCSLTLRCAKRSSWASSEAGPVLCLLTACLNLNPVLCRANWKLRSTPWALAFKSSIPRAVSCRAGDKFTGKVWASALNSEFQGSEEAWLPGPFIPVLKESSCILRMVCHYCSTKGHWRYCLCYLVDLCICLWYSMSPMSSLQIFNSCLLWLLLPFILFADHAWKETVAFWYRCLPLKTLNSCFTCIHTRSAFIRSTKLLELFSLEILKSNHNSSNQITIALKISLVV